MPRCQVSSDGPTFALPPESLRTISPELYEYLLAVHARTFGFGGGAGDLDDANVAPIYHTDPRALTWLGTRSTTDLTEGTRQYFTTSRARQAISATAPLAYVTDTGVLSFTGTTRIGHTWAIVGEVMVQVGEVDYLLPHFFNVPTGTAPQLVGCRGVVHTGGPVTLSLYRNDAPIAGYVGLSITTTPTTFTTTALTLANNDTLRPVVTAIAATPQNMSFTVFVDYAPHV